MLLDNLPALRERLAQQDIKVQHFDVHVTGQSAGGSPGQAFYNSDSNSRAWNNRSGQTVAADAGDAATAAVADPARAPRARAAN